MKLILHSKPWLKDEDYISIENVLKSGMIAQGKRTQDFEHELSKWVGIENGGVAVGSGGAALVLALSALGLKMGDEVILPTYVCSTVFEAVITSGATPVLCDVGENWVVTKEVVEKHINKKTRALIIPHMYGIFADIKSFHKFGIPIIEDCAQAIDYKGKRKICSDIVMFSFHPTKCLTTGEGGIAISDNQDLVNAMLSIRNGSKELVNGRLFSPMSDISASLGLSQLSRYHEALDRRKDLALKYILALKEVIPDSLHYNAFENSMFFRFPIKIIGGLDLFQDLFAQKNIFIRRGVDRLLHRIMGFPDEKFKESVKLFNTTISLPIYPALTDEEHSYCVKSAIEIFSKNYSYLNNQTIYNKY